MQVRLFGKHGIGSASRRQTGSDEVEAVSRAERWKEAAFASLGTKSRAEKWILMTSLPPSFPFLLNWLKIGFRRGNRVSCSLTSAKVEDSREITQPPL